MQEEVISLRLLVFIDGQIYFSCDSSHYSEAMNWSGKPLRDLFYSRASAYNAILKNPKADFRDFSALMMYYMLRRLTFQNDVLRAAQGMLRKFSVRSGLHCFEGLPPPFERSLLFQKSMDLLKDGYGGPGRREGFPSYSWIGWKNPSLYDVDLWSREVSNDKNVEKKSESSAGFRGWIIWHCKLEDGNLFRITDTGRLRKALLLKPSDTLQNSRDRFQQISIAVTDVSFWNIRSVSYPLLLFWTICINLRLKRAPQLKGEPPEPVDYFAMDKFGESCGKVDMDTTIHETGEGKFAFLSATDNTFWALMLVWKDGVAERRGVAELSKSALDGCLPPGPRWKAITLG